MRTRRGTARVTNSVFAKDDKVIHGPATKALERAQILVDEY